MEVIRKTRPHIILTDIRMPKMDGLELSRRVREELPAAKIVVLSGYDDFAYAQQALRFGVVDYLLKPVWAEELHRVMGELVKTIEKEFQEKLEYITLKKEISPGIEHYLNSIKREDEGMALAALDTLIQQLKTGDPSPEQLKKAYLKLSEWTLEVLRYDGFLAAGELKAFKELYLELQPLLTEEELDRWLRKFTQETVKIVRAGAGGGQHHPAITKALAYIDAHYHEELTIAKVAEAVLLSPSYFSHIFNRLRGESFSDHLNKVRVAKAKELLASNLYKVYEVSSMVGYNDYKYFSSVFKKITGLTPTEYLLLLRE